MIDRRKWWTFRSLYGLFRRFVSKLSNKNTMIKGHPSLRIMPCSKPATLSRRSFAHRTKILQKNPTFRPCLAVLTYRNRLFVRHCVEFTSCSQHSLLFDFLKKKSKEISIEKSYYKNIQNLLNKAQPEPSCWYTSYWRHFCGFSPT